VGTHVLRLKAAESYQETSQCTYLTGLKNPDKPKIFINEKRKKSFVPPLLSGFGEDPD